VSQPKGAVHFRDTFDRVNLQSEIEDTGLDDIVAFNNVCDEVPPTGIKLSQCNRFRKLLQDLQNPDIYQIKVLSPPDVSVFTDPDLYKLAIRVAAHVEQENKKITAYEAKDEMKGIDDKELHFLAIAIPMLGFAFGLGLARRALDLYTDWHRP